MDGIIFGAKLCCLDCICMKDNADLLRAVNICVWYISFALIHSKSIKYWAVYCDRQVHFICDAQSQAAMPCCVEPGPCFSDMIWYMIYKDCSNNNTIPLGVQGWIPQGPRIHGNGVVAATTPQSLLCGAHFMPLMDLSDHQANHWSCRCRSYICKEGCDVSGKTKLSNRSQCFVCEKAWPWLARNDIPCQS